MKDDLDLTVIEILDHISSVAFTGQRLNGAGLTREEARACQEGFVRYMDWQGLTIEREIHPLTLEEGTAEINHYHQEIHGNYMPFKLPMGLCESPATYMACCQSLLRTSSSEKSERGSPRDKGSPNRCTPPLEGGGTSIFTEDHLMGIQIPVIVNGTQFQ